MPPLAYFGIESSGLSLAVDLLILFAVVFYFALVYWTYADARRRIVDPVMVGLSTVVALLFPLVGPIVYMILRPPEYLEDVRERELEMQAAEVRLAQVNQLLCPYCDYRVEREFVRCPSCLRKLKERCVNCSRPLDQAWTICPYCEADVPGLGSPRVRRRRSGALEEEMPAFERSAAPEQETGEATLIASEPSLASSASERRANEQRRQSDRYAAAAARAAARAGRPRPAP
jgi:hypothetical protein